MARGAGTAAYPCHGEQRETTFLTLINCCSFLLPILIQLLLLWVLCGGMRRHEQETEPRFAAPLSKSAAACQVRGIWGSARVTNCQRAHVNTSGDSFTWPRAQTGNRLRLSHVYIDTASVVHLLWKLKHKLRNQ